MQLRIYAKDARHMIGGCGRWRVAGERVHTGAEVGPGGARRVRAGARAARHARGGVRLGAWPLRCHAALQRVSVPPLPRASALPRARRPPRRLRPQWRPAARVSRPAPARYALGATLGERSHRNSVAVFVRRLSEYDVMSLEGDSARGWRYVRVGRWRRGRLVLRGGEEAAARSTGLVTQNGCILLIGLRGTIY